MDEEYYLSTVLIGMAFKSTDLRRHQVIISVIHRMYKEPTVDNFCSVEVSVAILFGGLCGYVLAILFAGVS